MVFPDRKATFSPPAIALRRLSSILPLFLAVIISEKLIWPAIARRPRGIRALKNEIRTAIIADNKDHVTLQLLAFSGEPADVNATHPVAWNFDGRANRPLTIAQPVGTDRQIRLNFTGEPTEARDVSPTGTAGSMSRRLNPGPADGITRHGEFLKNFMRKAA
jgi:hypothetical protein